MPLRKRRRVVFVGFVVFNGRDLVFPVEPAAEVDHLAAVAAEGEVRRARAGPWLFDRRLADGAAHHVILELKSEI